MCHRWITPLSFTTQVAVQSTVTCTTVDTELCNGRVNAFHSSRVFTSSYPLIPRRGMKLHMSHCYQVSGFPYLCNDEARCHHWSLSPHLIPPWGSIKQMSTSKRNQSINRCLCWVTGSVSKEDTREDGLGQEPPILQEAVSLRACPSTIVTKEPFFPQPVAAIVPVCSHSLLF